MREINARPYVYAGHIVPHDAQARELGTGKSRLEVLDSLGLRNITLAPLHRIEDINAGRMFIRNAGSASRNASAGSMRSSSTARTGTTSCRCCGQARCTTGPRMRRMRSGISR